eukprot:7129458-Prymnesium_polylepis.1
MRLLRRPIHTLSCCKRCAGAWASDPPLTPYREMPVRIAELPVRPAQLGAPIRPRNAWTKWMRRGAPYARSSAALVDPHTATHAARERRQNNQISSPDGLM